MTVYLTDMYEPKVMDCNNCHKLIGKMTVQKERLTNGRNGYYFTCDKCGCKYPFAAISDEGERLLRKIKGIKKSKAKKDLSKLQKYLCMYCKEIQPNYTKEDILNDRKTKT